MEIPQREKLRLGERLRQFGELVLWELRAGIEDAIWGVAADVREAAGDRPGSVAAEAEEILRRPQIG